VCLGVPVEANSWKAFAFPEIVPNHAAVTAPPTSPPLWWSTVLVHGGFWIQNVGFGRLGWIALATGAAVVLVHVVQQPVAALSCANASSSCSPTPPPPPMLPLDFSAAPPPIFSSRHRFRLIGAFHAPHLHQVFSSTIRFGRAFVLSMWGAVLVFFLFLFLGVGVHHSAQTACLVLAFVDLYVVANAAHTHTLTHSLTHAYVQVFK
jgi:hypothetical protein